MKVTVLCFFMAVGLAYGGVVIPATTLVRSPVFDSAVVKSDRIGGSFSYSTLEGHGYIANTYPYYSYAAPVLSHYLAPATYYTPSLVASPSYFQTHPVVAANPVFDTTFVAPAEDVTDAPAKVEDKPVISADASSNDDSVSVESV